MSDDKILVIGASGSIGVPLVDALAALGKRVKAATRRPAALHPVRTGVEGVYFDYADPDSFAPALVGVDRVFMLAAPTDPDPDRSLRAFVEAAGTAGVERLVLLTSLRLKAPQDPGGFLWGEKAVRDSGLDFTILRPGWLMQTFVSGFILDLIKQHESLCLPAGEGRIGLIDARDVAACAACVLTEAEHAGRTYLLTGEEALSLREVSRIIASARGRPLPYTDVSLENLEQMLAHKGAYPGPIEYMAPFFDAVRSGLWDVTFDTVARLLGRRPTAFTRFAREHAAIWQ
ncbi:MAG: NAD(P)H-binding protein [Gammaproteobacteria bacterium]